MIKIVLLLLVILFTPTVAHSLAIAPGQGETDFSPNELKNFDFELINNEDRTISVEMFAKGDLASAVSFEKTKFLMRPHESKQIRFNVTFPSGAKLPSTISVIAKTAAGTKIGATINAYIALEFRLLVRGPSENSKIQQQKASRQEAFSLGAAEIEIENVQFENINKETAKLEIEIRNSGTADTEVTTEVKFGEGISAKSASAAPVKITGGATKRIVTYVDVRGMPTGSYNAEILLKYADKLKRQLVKLQIIESGTESPQTYIYIIVGILIAFNAVFVLLIANKPRQ